jgi:hypothetical protein
MVVYLKLSSRASMADTSWAPNTASSKPFTLLEESLPLSGPVFLQASPVLLLDSQVTGPYHEASLVSHFTRGSRDLDCFPAAKSSGTGKKRKTKALYIGFVSINTVGPDECYK